MAWKSSACAGTVGYCWDTKGPRTYHYTQEILRQTEYKFLSHPGRKVVFFMKWQASNCMYLESPYKQMWSEFGFGWFFHSVQVRGNTELQSNILWKVPVNLLQEHTLNCYGNFGIHCSTVHSDPFHYFMEHMDLAVNFNREDNFV